MEVVALVALVLAALAPPAAASAANGAISGKVTRASGGLPVLDAEVCAEEQMPPFEYRCKLTAGDGSYEIDGLPPSEYVVSFETGESSLYLIREFWNGVGRYEEATAVTVTSGVTTPGINAALVEGGAITGSVTAPRSGLPVSKVLVCSWWEEGDESDGCDETWIDGSYEIRGVHPGLHEVEFLPNETFYYPQFLSSVPVTVGTRTENVDVVLSDPLTPNGQISGHVYAAATHQPLAGIAVCAIDIFGESRGCAYTANSGAYELADLPAGPLRIAFSPAPTEFKSFEPGEISADAWPTQFWNMKPTLAQATMVSPGHGVVTGIDAMLGPDPEPLHSPTGSSTPAPIAATPTSLICRKGFVKKRVKRKPRCARRHRRHHRHHRHR